MRPLEAVFFLQGTFSLLRRGYGKYIFKKNHVMIMLLFIEVKCTSWILGWEVGVGVFFLLDLGEALILFSGGVQEDLCREKGF
jgi:hypothetical protein